MLCSHLAFGFILDVFAVGLLKAQSVYTVHLWQARPHVTRVHSDDPADLLVKGVFSPFYLFFGNFLHVYNVSILSS